MSGLLRQLCTKLNNFSKTINVTNTSSFLNRFYSNAPTPYEIVDPNKNKLITEDIIKKINQEVSNSQRLFAIVHLAGKQFKVTEGDLIVIEGYWPPTVGDKINLNKVLLLGASDFTLIGRPLIQNDLVNVHATVIEKTLSHTKTHFKKKRRKQYMRINFYRIQQTMLRINKVEFVGELNKPADVSSVDRIIL